MNSANVVGAVIELNGVVQGVGFRPFIYRRAHQFHLTGSVRNTASGVLVNVDGRKSDIEDFFREVRESPPVLAEIHASSLSFTDPAGFTTFAITESADEGEGFTPVSPDIATCVECLSDILDSGNRRHRYAFTNCTNCGPRFTIVRSVPYDRQRTTMSVFPMCPRCAEEYGEPLDRRYHAQPNACPECGPSLRIYGAGGRSVDSCASGGPHPRDPVSEAVELLHQGKVLAIKGLGGYHLAADPFKCDAVRALRARKRRPGKPFALMARDVSTARKYCRIGESEEHALLSFERPILLLEKVESSSTLCPEIAPDTALLGIMLPYTPLHHVLMKEGPEMLIMTSGNVSEEPLSYMDGDAFSTLGGIADAFLTHNRDIQRPCDDSVFMSVDGFPVPIRRSRGYVPRAVDVCGSRAQVFAAGASEKNTFCVCKGGRAFLSHHIGDLNNTKSVDAYARGVEDFLAIFRVKPEAVACDLHPDYVSTRFAEKLAGEIGGTLFRVQHHHAHIASLLGERKHHGKVIGVAFDGTGYGPDGTVWGGEFLLADQGEYERVGHFACVPMPGGEKSILEIDRMGVSYLLAAYGSQVSIPSIGFLERVGEARLALLGGMIRANINCPLTSSCGRLFDAVSALLGLCEKPSYDAQGAILLETAAGMTAARGIDHLDTPYPFSIEGQPAGSGGENGKGAGVIRFDETVREIVRDIGRSEPVDKVSRRFHSTVVASVAEMCGRIRDATGIGTVGLSGGAFQNRILLSGCREKLEKRGFNVLVHRVVPPNDGGISLGQCAFALHHMERGDC